MGHGFIDDNNYVAFVLGNFVAYIYKNNTSNIHVVYAP